MRITSMCTFICVSVLFSVQQLMAADPVPSQGSQSVVAGVPTGASPVPGSNPPLNYSLTVYYTDPTGKNTSTVIMVPGIPVTAGLPKPTVAQVNAASLAKQMAIIKAINAANIPIKPVTIGGVTYNTLTATANAMPVAGAMYPTGATMPQNVLNAAGKVVAVVQVPVMAAAALSAYTVNGVTQKVIDPGTAAAKLGNGVYRTAGNTVTGEVGNGKGNFSPGTTPSMGSSGGSGMAMATFGGLGATVGLTTGLDASGNPSVVGFGFIDETSSTPVDYIAAFDPQAGMTDADVLTDISELFNEDFSVDGYTSTYDPTTDTLTINQLLPAADITWSADSDTGMFLEDSLDTVAPEPGTLVLLGTGLVALAGVFRQRRMSRA